MKYRFPGEPIRMRFIHRSERRMREAFMSVSHPPLFFVPKLDHLDLADFRPGLMVRISKP